MSCGWRAALFVVLELAVIVGLLWGLAKSYSEERE